MCVAGIQRINSNVCVYEFFVINIIRSILVYTDSMIALQKPFLPEHTMQNQIPGVNK